MGIWKRFKRAMGVSDPTYWRQPGYLRLRLVKDWLPRLIYSTGIGMIVGGVFLSILIIAAPPGELWWGILLGLLMVAVTAMFLFVVRDTEEVIITLDDEAVHRETNPMLANPFGFRDREESWFFANISGCGIVPSETLGGQYSLLVIHTQESMITLGIPRQLEWRSVVAELTARGLKVQQLNELPAQAVPDKSISKKHLITALVMGCLGLIFTCSGVVGRLFVHPTVKRVDQAAVKKVVDKVNLGVTIREFTTAGNGGINQAKISPDGKWVWGLTAKGKKHLLWNDAQDKPHGELTIPEARDYLCVFTPDNSRVVVRADREVYVWRLQPLEQLNQFTRSEIANALAISQDGTKLIVSSISQLRVYDLQSGELVSDWKPTIGAITDAALSGDGNQVIVAQHSRIISTNLADGVSNELVKFRKPNAAYLFGSLSAGGRWAAMKGRSGIDVFDLSRKKRQTTIRAGMAASNPHITSDGKKVASVYLGGAAVWDVNNGKPAVRFEATSRVRIDLSAGSPRLVGYARNKSKVYLWEFSSN